MEEEEGDVVKALFNVIEFVGSLRNYRWMQTKECFNLVRRIKQLVPMLEEVREFETGPLPAEAEACLGNLKKVFVSAKKLLRCCHDGSKIYLSRHCPALFISSKGNPSESGIVAYARTADTFSAIPGSETSPLVHVVIYIDRSVILREVDI